MEWNIYFRNNCNLYFLKIFAFLFHNNLLLIKDILYVK